MNVQSSVTKNHITPPDVFDYLDFRDYLGDFVKYKKSQNFSYSYSQFARHMGVSRSYFGLLLKGKRRLSENKLPLIMQICHLVPVERAYLTALVKWNQAEDEQLKEKCWEVLRASIPKDYVHVLEGSENNMMAHWFVLGLYTLMELKSFKLDVDWIYHKFFGQVSKVEIEAAIKDLEANGFIEVKNGKVSLTRKETLFARNTPRNVIQNFHVHNIKLGELAVRKVEPEKRDVSTCSIALKEENVAYIKKRIKELREEIVDLSMSIEDPEKVYQLNIQFFPLGDE